MTREPCSRSVPRARSHRCTALAAALTAGIRLLDWWWGTMAISTELRLLEGSIAIATAWDVGQCFGSIRRARCQRYIDSTTVLRVPNRLGVSFKAVMAIFTGRPRLMDRTVGGRFLEYDQRATVGRFRAERSQRASIRKPPRLPPVRAAH